MRRKIRRFGDIERYSQQMSDSSDSDFDPSPDGNSKPNRTKKKEKQLLEGMIFFRRFNFRFNNICTDFGISLFSTLGSCRSGASVPAQ